MTGAAVMTLLLGSCTGFLTVEPKTFMSPDNILTMSLRWRMPPMAFMVR